LAVYEILFEIGWCLRFGNEDVQESFRSFNGVANWNLLFGGETANESEEQSHPVANLGRIERTLVKSELKGANLRERQNIQRTVLVGVGLKCASHTNIQFKEGGYLVNLSLLHLSAEVIADSALSNKSVYDRCGVVPVANNLGSLCWSQIFDADMDVKTAVGVDLACVHLTLVLGWQSESLEHGGKFVKSFRGEDWTDDLPAELLLTSVLSHRGVTLNAPLAILVINIFTTHFASFTVVAHRVNVGHAHVLRNHHASFVKCQRYVSCRLKLVLASELNLYAECSLIQREDDVLNEGGTTFYYRRRGSVVATLSGEASSGGTVRVNASDDTDSASVTISGGSCNRLARHA
jgi:hypothetical protein